MLRKTGYALMLCCALLMLCKGGWAQEATQPLFSPDYLKTLPAARGQAVSAQQYVQLHGTYYACLSNHQVHRVAPGMDKPALYCDIPHQQENPYMPYGSLLADEQRAIADNIHRVCAGDGKLWGINLHNGRVAEILDTGPQWQAQALDLSFLTELEDRMLRLADAFVADNRLYTLVALDNAAHPWNNYLFYACDMRTGKHQAVAFQNVQSYCHYPENKLLVLTYRPDQGNSLHLYDLASREWAPARWTLPIIPFSQAFGGLAYDGATDTLCVAGDSRVWQARPDGIFRELMKIPMEHLTGETQAWLAEGRYVIIQGNHLNRYDLSQEQARQKTLTVQGGHEDFIGMAFGAAHRDIPVIYQSDHMTADQIAQQLITQSDAVDVYLVPADYLFTQLKRKGFALDLSGSDTLTKDIASMYPAIQRLLKDKAGKPVAYPHFMSVDGWQINEGMWRHVYGDYPLPRTFAELMRAWLLFETELADKHDDIVMDENYDHVIWMKYILNAYFQQYASKDAVPDLRHPLLVEALQGLEKVNEARQARGGLTRLPKESEMRQQYPLLFVLDSRIEVTNDTVYHNKEMLPGTDVAVNVFSDIPVMTFEPGRQANPEGRLNVLFINPYSRNKEAALQYLETAAKAKYNIRTWYATHPEANEPVPDPSYEAILNRMLEDRALLKTALDKATGVEKTKLTQDLAALDNTIAIQDSAKWEISPATLIRYRALAPSINF